MKNRTHQLSNTQYIILVYQLQEQGKNNIIGGPDNERTKSTGHRSKKRVSEAMEKKEPRQGAREERTLLGKAGSKEGGGAE